MAGILSSPHLSIVMPTLNSASTLREALDSVVNQHYRDLELLIIDSVSQDATLEIARSYGEKDARIRIISEPDKGIYDAMNKGIALSQGNWIFFLGSDDRLIDDAVLEKLFSTPGLDDFDLVYGNVVSPSFRGPYDGPFDYDKLLKRNMPHQAIFFKKGLFDRMGRYDIRYRQHADWAFNIRCLADGRYNTRHIDLVIAHFGAEGVSSRHDQPFLREVMIPALLKRLNQKRLSFEGYDDWWRVLRNAGIRSREELLAAAGEEVVPRRILKIADWQARLPVSLLKKGVFSKLFMTLSYVVNH